jgi:hypothetical protein
MIYDKYRGKNTRPQCVKLRLISNPTVYVNLIFYEVSQALVLEMKWGKRYSPCIQAVY